MSKSEFGFHAKDEDDIGFYLVSNAGADKMMYLDKAKSMKRPLLVEIKGEIFSNANRHTNFALTIEEARNLNKELSRMLDYLEE